MNLCPFLLERSLTNRLLHSWNKKRALERGSAMANEFKEKGVNVALGPAVGALGRVVTGGRNREGDYFPPSNPLAYNYCFDAFTDLMSKPSLLIPISRALLYMKPWSECRIAESWHVLR